MQEIGLGKALCNRGINVDIVYYTKGEDREQIIQVGNKRIKILWRKGLKLLRSGYYKSILNKNFLANYDLVICSEYSQIMSVLLSKLHK